MYVVVEHEFTNPQVAFARGDRLIKNEGAPADTRVLQFYPNRDNSGAVCLWDTPSVEAVRQYVDVTLGDASTNTCWEVETEHAFARPPSGIAQEPALNV
jgi:hypothetical protein